MLFGRFVWLQMCIYLCDYKRVTLKCENNFYSLDVEQDSFYRGNNEPRISLYLSSNFVYLKKNLQRKSLLWNKNSRAFYTVSVLFVFIRGSRTLLVLSPRNFPPQHFPIIWHEVVRRGAWSISIAFFRHPFSCPGITIVGVRCQACLTRACLFVFFSCRAARGLSPSFGYFRPASARFSTVDNARRTVATNCVLLDTCFNYR